MKAITFSNLKKTILKESKNSVNFFSIDNQANFKKLLEVMQLITEQYKKDKYISIEEFVDIFEGNQEIFNFLIDKFDTNHINKNLFEVPEFEVFWRSSLDYFFDLKREVELEIKNNQKILKLFDLKLSLRTRIISSFLNLF